MRKEYASKIFSEFLNEEGISRELYVVEYTSQQNDVAERAYIGRNGQMYDGVKSASQLVGGSSKHGLLHPKPMPIKAHWE